jgi:transposase
MRYQILAPEEEQTLREAIKNHENPFFRNRCQSILMSHQKIQVQAIAKTFNVRTRTVYTWFDNYESQGFLGIMTIRGQGRKTVLNSCDLSQTNKIIEWIDKGESLKNVANLFNKEFDKAVSKSMIKNFIKKKDIHGNELENG